VVACIQKVDAAHPGTARIERTAQWGQGGIMPKLSAGILLYRHPGTALEVFLVHPGGPFWAKKDLGAWSIPKGEYTDGEDAVLAARREFREETGFDLPQNELYPLGEARLDSGKIIKAWCIEGTCDAEAIRSNTFRMEWPPKSAKMQDFPEVDRAGWFPLPVAEQKIHPRQREFLARLSLRPPGSEPKT
jgi:predicted NUDIX family NTP pyrophosphohydrolase